MSRGRGGVLAFLLRVAARAAGHASDGFDAARFGGERRTGMTDERQRDLQATVTQLTDSLNSSHQHAQVRTRLRSRGRHVAPTGARMQMCAVLGAAIF